ncbi:MAG: hypothetical protein KDI63_07385 [Gammaproteobacteria bacterium]|nr:hypothetical protein [Gammaproteobacteria bacterium]
MSTITNDQQLRQALTALSLEQQRSLGVQFAANIRLPKIGDSELSRVLVSASQSGNDSRTQEFAYQSAKSIATRTFTACGNDADWQLQAEHFVAASCAAALTPEGLLAQGSNPAWKAAIQARMARNCLMMDDASGDIDNESQNQYRITEKFLSG